MNEIPITEARATLGMLVNRAGIRGERIFLTRNGKPVAAIVPFEDAQFMQKREDEKDAREAAAVLAKREKPIPYSRARKELGLDEVPHRDHAGRRKATRRSA